MAEAMCGPSNALQSFQKHAQIDRTLQQDRLIGPRHSPAQGFRSRDPRTGTLDADFHAFENAAPNAFQFQDPAFNHHLSAPVPLQHAVPSQSSGWATDFQNMHISDQPIPAQQFRTEAPLMMTTNGGWQNEFMRQRQNNMTSVAQGKQTAFHQDDVTSLGMNQMQFSNPSMMYSGMQNTGMMQYPEQTMQTQEQHIEQSSLEDWSKAFEEAYQDAFEEAQETVQTTTQQSDQILHDDGTYTNDHSQHMESNIQQPENIKIGSDAIQYTEQKDRTVNQESEDSNALARVAGELLHNLQHEQSNEKFQNSQFLDLMRKIRDRQIEVRNNDFESTQTNINQTATTIQDPGNQKPTDEFSFPDMNGVFDTHPNDAVDYSFDTDQYPTSSGSSRPMAQSQIQDLHPGGKLYPSIHSTVEDTEMSGAVGGISADDFEKFDESRDFAVRFAKQMAV